MLNSKIKLRLIFFTLFFVLLIIHFPIHLETQVVESNQERAINRFSKSWSFAQSAIKIAEKEFKVPTWLKGSLITKVYASTGSLGKDINSQKEGSLLIRNLIKWAIGILFILIYGSIVWLILKLIASTKKEKLEPINKKILLIATAIGVIGGILAFLTPNLIDGIEATDFFSHYRKLIPTLNKIFPTFVLSFSILLFSFILFKKFPAIWKNIKMRLFYLILSSIIWLNIPCLIFQTLEHPRWLELTIGSFLLMLIWMLLFLNFVFGLIGLIIFSKYSIFFAIPTAFIITKGVKKRKSRIWLIIILTILICFVSGSIVAGMGWS